MAREVQHESDLPIEVQLVPVHLSEDRVRRETGERISYMREAVRDEYVYPRFREWLTDEARPGQFHIKYHRGDRFTKTGYREPRLLVYISDPTVRFEFKLRWA